MYKMCAFLVLNVHCIEKDAVDAPLHIFPLEIVECVVKSCIQNAPRN